MSHRKWLTASAFWVVVLGGIVAGCGSGAVEEATATSTAVTPTTDEIVAVTASSGTKPDFCSMLDLPPGIWVADPQSLDLLDAIEAQTADNQTRAMLAGVADDLRPLSEAAAANDGDAAAAFSSLDADVMARVDSRLASSINWWGPVLDRARSECDQFEASEAEQAAAEAAESTTVDNASSPDSEGDVATDTETTLAVTSEDEPTDEEIKEALEAELGLDLDDAEPYLVDDDGQFEDEELGVSFSYPADGKWQVQRVPLVGELADPDFIGWRVDVVHPEGGGYLQIKEAERSSETLEFIRSFLTDDPNNGETTVSGLPAFFERRPPGDSELFGSVGERVIYDVYGTSRSYTVILNYEHVEDADGVLFRQAEEIVASI